MEKEAMEGHVNVMLPQENLRSDLPNGGIVLGHDKEISTLQEEISALRSRQRHLNRRRREALGKLIDLKGSIRVFCRVRPSISTSNIKIKSPVTVEQENIAVRAVGIKKDSSVDRVFDQESTQDDVFHEVKPILRSALDGHNVCILAFGQTGTGKTYTMEGTSDNLGAVPRAIQELFSHAAQDTSSTYSFSISMLEVYMGSLRDLLAPRQQPLFRSIEGNTTCNLSILATTSGSVQVEGLTDVAVPDLKKANQWYCRGRRSRSTSGTNVNNVSSRSHCLTRITIRRCGGVTEQVSKLWLVDLGGSERLLKTGASGLTMDEGKAINLSLSALGDVIAALRRKRSHVPYRNSKLTQILSDSLGDGSKVVMVVHISPSKDDVGETICSLGFAKRARLIESSRELSEDLKMLKRKRLAELDKEICDAEQELGVLNEQIRSAERSVEERKKLSPSVCQALSDDKGSPRSILVAGHIDAVDSPQATERAKSRMAHHGSVPHFMSATVCSRQRHGAASHSVSKPRLTRSVNTYSSKPSGSQSFSHSASKAKSVALSSGEPRLKYLSVKSDQINVSSNSIDSTAASAPRPRPRESLVSRPVQRAPLHQHRRRMSCLT
ncbi:kinesin-like protein KIN-14O [Aegilops tauschii subsp. strangulata]|uniref:Kinesin motor domain-containing protein n=2 Tax=Aegilops tauschii subsp. strangulata TaxID=200361 RepID=A0A453HW07_AEGTS|nr:kinesin-like protein KIN-14O [Aegilops tauschii subsp. strangulata]XP_020192427.1 kinesin-like protein KIN-14O [Aegilops tauschii subsp. strangulata]XP_020192428.1 kinesin-like protein KIN-14O [Aegilops tauschii subsp. strangulata]XP_020192430.1 kinesin-like protein KIN-14O [Aegilops tauschii subsp. strangulata]XP_020192432.1 kinesin-like protein KIN-14O [Aegilops tauschii subsp. strangulata]XP_020192433.1 kinesin-like protein KIN-14O [Aegilops tauschii subsp. strangulata]XP_040242827.1 ki